MEKRVCPRKVGRWPPGGSYKTPIEALLEVSTGKKSRGDKATDQDAGRES